MEITKIVMETRTHKYKSSIKCCYILLFFLMATYSSAAQTVVSSIAALAAAASQSNQTVIMTPGVYNMIDYLTPTVIANNTPADSFGRRAMLLFSGSNNTFDFTGVTINVDTALLNDLGSSVVEFHLTGNYINFKGLTVTDIGNSPTASGGQSLTVSGDNILVENVRLNMSGSSPYGYGDLLGKGSPNLVSMKKHSGLLVGGLNVTIKGCSIYSKSFGHLFFVQGGRNVLFENCYAEADTRTTDAMLAETSGPAFNLNFEAVYANYDGVKVITPGYTKSLSEVGFRTYGEGAGNTTAGVTLKNCTVRNARVGFALEVGGPILIQNCEATGCESGYNITEGKVENSRGDAVNGPLLYLSGSGTEVELELMPTLPTTILHAIATISGTNHKVSLKNWNDIVRTQEHKILVGATRPAGTNPFSPLGTETTSGIILNNCTKMPVEVLSKASSSTINSNGTISNSGTGITFGTSVCQNTFVEGLIDEPYEIAANTNYPDPFYGWNRDVSGTYGVMSLDEPSDQLVCTFENNGSDYIRFYWRKLDPSQHKLNSANYPILAMKGKRPQTYANFVLLMNNTVGTTIQYKDGLSVNGAETLAYSKLLPGTTDVYYWDLSSMIPSNETWTLNGFNCVDTKEVNPISVMKLDYLKSFTNLDALKGYASVLSTKDNVFKNDKFNLYPNPSTNGDFNISAGAVTNLNVKIYTVLGELVLENNYPVDSQNLTIKHNLKKGIYIVKLNNTGTTKLIIN